MAKAKDGKKKICVIGQFPPPIHGLSKALDTLCRGLDDAFTIQKIDVKDNKKILFNLAQILFSNADTFYFTISQSKGGNFRDLLILRLILWKKKKCIIHLHGGYYRQLVENELSEKQKKDNYKVMEKVDGAIVLGRSLKPIFQGMVPPERVFVVPNCVDDEFLLTDKEIEEKADKMNEQGVKDVLYLSNFIEEKGYREVLKLALCEKVTRKKTGKSNFHFHFAGAFFEDEEREYFENFVAEHELQDLVTLRGVVSGEDKRQLLKDCQYFILPTRYPKEGQPISILEAMGAGMAVVTTDHAGIPDMVKEGENGVVCRVGEEKDIDGLYQRTLTLTPRLGEIARRNYKLATTDYTERAYLEKLKALFEGV